MRPERQPCKDACYTNPAVHASDLDLPPPLSEFFTMLYSVVSISLPNSHELRKTVCWHAGACFHVPIMSLFVLAHACRQEWGADRKIQLLQVAQTACSYFAPLTVFSARKPLPVTLWQVERALMGQGKGGRERERDCRDHLQLSPGSITCPTGPAREGGWEASLEAYLGALPGASSRAQGVPKRSGWLPCP